MSTARKGTHGRPKTRIARAMVASLAQNVIEKGDCENGLKQFKLAGFLTTGRLPTWLHMHNIQPLKIDPLRGQSTEQEMASSCPARVKTRARAQVDRHPLNFSTKNFAYSYSPGR